MKLDLPSLDRLVHEYCVYRGIVEGCPTSTPGMSMLTSESTNINVCIMCLIYPVILNLCDTVVWVMLIISCITYYVLVSCTTYIFLIVIGLYLTVPSIWSLPLH